MRDRLIGLLLEAENKADENGFVNCNLKSRRKAEFVADHLLAEGVIVPKFTAGDHIWVIDREDGKAVEVSCVQYLANCQNCVIATAFINDYDFEETLQYHISETQERFDTELKVCPEEDCFLTREEAERALAERSEG